MSSCVVITQKDNIYIGADSACSIKTEYGFERHCNDMQKLFRFGNQVLFCSGKAIDVSDCVNWMYLNMPDNIDIDILACYLQNRFRNVFYDKYFNIEVLIADYEKKCVYQLSQYNNFEILKYESTDQLLVICGGYKTSNFFEKIKRNILLNKSVTETYIDAYKDMCDECVGGYITIYSSPNNFEKYKVDCFGEKIIQNRDNLFLVSSDFVTAGQIMGSRVVGGEIYSSNYCSGITSKTPTGTYINLNEGDFEFGGKKLVYDSSENTLTLRGVTIEWENTNPPDTSDIEGLDEYLEQLDGRIQTYSQTNDPSLDWDTPTEKAEHVGDLWINPDTGITKRWTDTYEWEVVTDSELVELAQSKAQIFTSTPTPPYYVGDLWVQGSTGDIMHCVTERLTGSFNMNDWKKSSKYTDDSAANAAASAAALAQQTGDMLVEGLGFQGTEITGGYIISPSIAGGFLNIANDRTGSKVIIDPHNLTGNNYIFQVYNGNKISVGIDSNGNASFNGSITATSLTLGTGVSISSDRVDGLSDVATSGKYSDLEGAPDKTKIIYKGDITQTTKTDDNGVSYTETKVPTSNGSITYDTYDAGDYIVFGRSKGTNSEGNNYVCVSKEGLLTARNALIYGTIYATNGEIGHWKIVSDASDPDFGALYSVNETYGYTAWMHTPGYNSYGEANFVYSILEGQENIFYVNTEGELFNKGSIITYGGINVGYLDESGLHHPSVYIDNIGNIKAKEKITAGEIETNYIYSTGGIATKSDITTFNGNLFVQREPYPDDGNVFYDAGNIYTVGGSIYSQKGDDNRGGNISANGDISAGGNISADGDISVGGSLYLLGEDPALVGAIGINIDGKVISIDSSSERYKENITENYNDDLNPENLYKLPVKQFNYKDEYKDITFNPNMQIGLIAEDVDKYFPSACCYNKQGQIEGWHDRLIIPAMLKLIQNQKSSIDILHQKYQVLAEEFDVIKSRLNE